MKNIYIFNESYGLNKMILGGKGANLVEMQRIGLPIPNGLIATTTACKNYFKNENTLTDEMLKEISGGIEKLEIETGKTFGGENPLLVSVRSGAPVSMPGMMDTILNLGLNDSTVERLIKKIGNERFAYDIYIRFIEMFSEIVKEVEKEKFHSLKNSMKGKSYKEIIESYKQLYKVETGEDFPDEPEKQVVMAIESIFRSWNNERAKIYRQIHGINEDMGTGVVVQEMVFGNFNELSGTGVAFTRNPSTGENLIFGEYLLEAQGEDIVAGIRTPEPLVTMKDQLPEIYDEFVKIANILEKHYGDMQDIEFTIEDGKLFILQTRNGKRSPHASVKIAIDMVKEGLVEKEDAILMVDTELLPQIFNGTFEESDIVGKKLLGKGLPGSAGVAVGKVVLSTEKIKEGESVILVRVETSPEDIKGMSLAKGIVTVKGGATSHGAVVARGMGKCCITGCEEIKIDKSESFFTINGVVVKEGDIISINGYNGEIYKDAIKLKVGEINGDLKEFLEWCKEYKTLEVRMNADTPKDVEVGRNFGAEGVGLCRTEHMFFEDEKIWNVREMIIATTKEERELALKKLLELQKIDFKSMLSKMDGLPMNIRLLDPPFHEFLPKTEKDIEKLALLLKRCPKEITDRIKELKEENPMLGHRGCRLAVTFPEIYEMQARAIIESTIESKRNGVECEIEIMIPFIGGISEFKYIKERILETIQKVFDQYNESIDYKLGTMMELPRACLIANEIAEESAFFSFGTNDLTQTTYGISRDDSIKFIDHYKAKNIMKRDPFQSIDTRGVGKLIVLAKELGKSVKPDIKIGVCGEHGGDPKSIEYFNELGFNYISCSPFRVPTAIVASAQSAILKNRGI
ncbi:pyruvate, phosphate dikinase [uncultured Cetobacterium sp.]|uniref:pyruvate, phosphate dikinase n=1 Tax=uncultured Cetobacterium sp. TaxID=527638 RepID=UPI00261E4532|nr:pyruvate, phosphate dikinase [uncultured Cetobacterium sp.]